LSGDGSIERDKNPGPVLNLKEDKPIAQYFHEVRDIVLLVLPTPISEFSR
jgi:hypothetical protein